MSQTLLPYLELVSCLQLTAVHFSRNKKHRNFSNKKFFTKKFPLQLCCWNVKTQIDLENSERPERRTAFVTNELAMYNIDIAALSEKRLSGEDQLTEDESGYTLFWSGRSEGEKREGGVGFAVRNTLIDRIKRPSATNDRVIRPRFPLYSVRYTLVISVYVPTLTSTDDVIMSFYQELRSLFSIPKEKCVMLLGDFNTRFGSDHNRWPLGLMALEK